MAPVLSALPQLTQLKVNMQLDREASFRQWVWPRGLRVLELRVPDRRTASDGERMLESLSPDRLPALEELTLHCWPNVCALAPLRGHVSLRRFTSIHSKQNQLTPEQVGVVRSWPALQYLSLHDGQMTAHTLQLLTDPDAPDPLLAQLQEVDLTKHSGSSLSELCAFSSRLPSLTRLQLKQWHFGHLPLLHCLPRLECAQMEVYSKNFPSLPSLLALFDECRAPLRHLTLHVTVAWDTSEGLPVTPRLVQSMLHSPSLAASLTYLRLQWSYGMSGKQLASIIAYLPHLRSCYLDNGDGHFYHADFFSKFLEPHALQSAGRLQAGEPALATEAVHASIAAAVAARSSSRPTKCADAATLRLSVNLTELQLEDSFFDSADL
jgi:hypothetical protein